MPKYKCTTEEFARLLFDEIIHTVIRQGFITKVIQSEDYTPSEKSEIESLGQKQIYQETDFFWMFLCTFVVHKELSDLDSDLAKRIHQCMRTMIDAQMLHISTESDKFTRRIGMYAGAIESDLECLGEENVISFLNLITSFYENLLGREVVHGEFQKARITFSLFVSETLCILQDTVKKIKADVILIDD